MIPLSAWLIVAAIVFALGVTGMMINRRNIIVLLMSIELMLLAVNTNLVAFAQYLDVAAGEIFVFFVLTVAAAEAAIGLAILVLFYRRCGSINVDNMRSLKG